MANADKNILITPSVGGSAEPTIAFTGFDNKTIRLRVLDDGTLSFEGLSGQLFSITDSLSGTIFSVNDISGIPSLEINSNGTISLAEFSGNVGIGTSSPATRLHVSGGPTGTNGWVKTATLQAQYPMLIFNSNSTKWAGIGYDHTAGLRFWVNSSNDDIPASTLALSIANSGAITAHGGITGTLSGNASSSTTSSALGTNTGTTNSSLQYWQLQNNSTLNPTTDWWYGLRMSHGDADTYYSATLALSFWSDDLRFRRKVAGTDQTWRTVLHSGGGSVTGGNVLSFVRSDNTTVGLSISAGTVNNFINAQNGGLIVTCATSIALDTDGSMVVRSSNGATTKLVVTASGLVGVNTPSPSGQLHITNNSSAYDAIWMTDSAVSNNSGTWRIGPGTGAQGFGIYSNTLGQNVFFASNTGAVTVGNLTVSNLTVNGTTTTVNSTTVTIDDPIFTLGGDTAPTVDDNKDRGIEFRWHNGTSAKIGFFGYDDSTGKFTFIPDATNTSEVFAGTKGTLDANIEWADVLNKPDPVVTVTLTGDITGTANATLTDLGNGTISVATTIAADSVALGTDTTGNYVATITGTANQVSVSGSGAESAAVTLSLPQNIHTGATPTFAQVSLGAPTASGHAMTAGRFGAVSTGGTLDFNHSTNARPGSGETLLLGNATNGPGPGTYFHTFSLEYATKDGTGNLTQLAIPYSDVITGGIHIRGRYQGTWGPWYKVWTSANDGAGSGLDADLLDGQSGAWYQDWTNVTNKPSIVNSITGTANQITASASTGAVTLSLPQSIHTAATPTFTSLTLSQATGTAPLTVSSTTLVTNLNAERVGGQTLANLDSRYIQAQYLQNLSIADVNNADNTGVTFYYSNGTNRPSGTDHAFFTMSYSSSWATQMAGDWRTNNWYVRTQNNGSWGSWATLWHSANDGAGSGLDADLFHGVSQVTYTTSLRATNNLTGGGTITHDGSGNFLWTTRFIVIANGRGALFATNGYFDIGCPTSGTITGVGGASNRTATAAGIPLNSWEALYYIMPIGSGNSSVAANFRVSSYTADVDIPHNWVLIAVKNGDNGMLYVSNGARLALGTSIASGTHDARRSATADTLTTSRTFTIGSTGRSFNGGANVTWSLSDIGAAATNQTMFIGTTSVAINRTSANLALTGISSIALPGSTSGTVTLQPAATAGTTTITLPATTGTVVTTGDSATVTNAMLTGSIANNKLANSAITVNSASTSLGGSVTLFAGTTTLQTSSANQALTGISSITLPGSSSGTVQLIPTAAAGTGTVLTLPATSGTVALTSQIPTVNNGTLTVATSGTGLSGSGTFTANQSSNATITITSNATHLNNVSTIVARDGSGNFSAGTITAAGLTVDTDTLFVDATNNRVGVLTTSPSATLHVAGSGSFQVDGTSILFPTNLANVTLGADHTSGDRLRLHRSGANSYIDFSGALHFRSGGDSEDLVVQSNGVTKIAKPSHNYVGVIFQSGSTQSIANNTATAINFNDEEFDYAGMHDNVTNNSRVTILVAGVYQFWGVVHAAESVNQGRYVEIRRYNSAGTLQNAWRSGADSGDTGSWVSPSVTASFLCDVNDYVQLWFYHDTGAARATLIDTTAKLTSKLGWTLLRATP